MLSTAKASFLSNSVESNIPSYFAIEAQLNFSLSKVACLSALSPYPVTGSGRTTSFGLPDS